MEAVLRDASADWEPLGQVARAGLPEARFALHAALQIVKAVGATQVRPEPDSGHMATTWEPQLRALVGCPTPGGWILGLRPEPPTLLLLDTDTVVRSELPLSGCTVAVAIGWLYGAIETLTGERPAQALALLGSEPTGHPFLKGEPFADGQHERPREELARWIGNAVRLLTGVREAHPVESSPVRCWPHHFDVALLLSIDRAVPVKQPRSIGVGLSLGDEEHPDPYWYVTPWPRVDSVGLPALPGGAVWHRGSWLGARLSAAAVLAAEDQARRVRGYLAVAIPACRALLERDRAAEA